MSEPDLELDLQVVANRFAPTLDWFNRFQNNPQQTYDEFLTTVTAAILAGWQESPAELALILRALTTFLAYQPPAAAASEAKPYWDSACELTRGLVSAFQYWLDHPPPVELVQATRENDIIAGFDAAYQDAVAYEQTHDQVLLARASNRFAEISALVIAGVPLSPALHQTVPDKESTLVRTWVTGLLTVVTAVSVKP